MRNQFRNNKHHYYKVFQKLTSNLQRSQESFDKSLNKIEKTIKENTLSNVKKLENISKKIQRSPLDRILRIFEIMLIVAALYISISTLNNLVEQTNELSRQNDILQEQQNDLKKQLRISEGQNQIMEGQSKIMGDQSVFAKEQNRISELQNSLSVRQTRLFNSQNALIELQNDKFDLQNTLISKQSYRMDQQTNLQEAERRGTLVYLLNNLLDRIDVEMKSNSNENRLSNEIIARIASLSQALKPYKYLKNDSIIKQAISPERGQLLAALLELNLDSITYARIFKRSNFTNSELIDFNLSEKVINGINLANSNMSNANLKDAKFINSNLSGVTLDSSIIVFTEFRNSDLSGASLRNIERGGRTKFIKCKLMNTDFSNTTIPFSTFEGRDLRYLALEKVTKSNSPKSSPFLTQIDSLNSFDLEFMGGKTLINKDPSTLDTVSSFQTALVNIDQSSTEVEDTSADLEFYEFYRIRTGEKYEDRDKKNIVFQTKVKTFPSNDFKEVNLSNSNLENTEFKNLTLNGVTFENSNAKGIRFTNTATYFNVNFNKTILTSDDYKSYFIDTPYLFLFKKHFSTNLASEESKKYKFVATSNGNGFLEQIKDKINQ